MTTSLVKKLIGIGVAAVAVAITVFTVTSRTPASDLGSAGTASESTLVATFEDALPIVSGSLVRLSGVNVGTVRDVKLVEGKAEVTIDLEQRFPLHQDATAAITANNLLGEKFINLSSGSPNTPLMEEPYRLPVSQTRTLVDLPDVVNSIDDPTGKALGLMVSSLGEGVDGKGEQAAQAITKLRPAAKQVDQLAKVLNTNNRELNELIDATEPVLAAVADKNGSEIDKVVDTTTATMSDIAARRTEASRTLQQLPDTLAEARGRLTQLAGVAHPTTKTLREIRPVTGQITDISRELRRFTDAADPALKSLRPVLDRGTELLKRAEPVVHELNKGGDGLRGVAGSANRLRPDVLGDNLTELMEFMKGWSLATSDYDGVSHYFKAILEESPKNLGKLAEGNVAPLGGNPLEKAPAIVPPRPQLGGTYGGSSSGGDESQHGGRTDQGPGDTPGTATGLTPVQESDMVGQMLGGR